MNEHSSRSHAIFIITIECSEVCLFLFLKLATNFEFYDSAIKLPACLSICLSVCLLHLHYKTREGDPL